MWNTFFADVATVASTDNFTEAMLADDLNVYKMLKKDVTNVYVYAELRNVLTNEDNTVVWILTQPKKSSGCSTQFLGTTLISKCSGL